MKLYKYKNYLAKLKPLIHRKVFLYFFLAFINIIFVYVIIWNVIAYFIGKQTTAFIDALQEIPISIAYYSYTISGFPFGFNTHLLDVSYHNEAKNFGIYTENIDVNLLDLMLLSLEFNFSKDLVMSFTGADQKKDRIVARFKDLHLQTVINKLDDDPITLEGTEGILQVFTNERSFLLEKIKASLRNEYFLISNRLEKSILFELSASNIRPTDFWKNILEDNFGDLKAKIYLRHPSKISELFRFPFIATRGFDPPEIIIDYITLTHPLSKFQLKGVLFVDGNFKLNGEVTLKVSNYRELLAFLEKKGVITPDFSKQTRNLLSFMVAKENIYKQSLTLLVSLKVKENVVYKDNIPLFALSEILGKN